MESSSRRAWMLVTCLLLVLFVPGHSKPFRKWSPGVYPNPQQDVYDCGRDGRKSSLCDPENILSKESQNMVDGLINEIAEGTPPFRSAQCGSLGQKGFQVWEARQGRGSFACMHNTVTNHLRDRLIVLYCVQLRHRWQAAAAAAALLFPVEEQHLKSSTLPQGAGCRASLASVWYC
jgi:hypothetical protein